MSAIGGNDQTTPTAQADSQVDLDIAERDFVASMDAIQEYLHLQGKLQGQLKMALLNLARAKYSMGPIGQAQYDNDMLASVRIDVTSETPSGGRRSFSLHRLQPGAAATTEQPPTAAATATAGKEPGDTTTEGSLPGSAAATTRGGTAATTTAAASATSASGASAKGKEPYSDDDDDEYYESDGGEDEEGGEELREANAFLRRMRLQAEGIQAGEWARVDGSATAPGGRNSDSSPGNGGCNGDAGGDGEGSRPPKSIGGRSHAGLHRRRRKRGGGGDPLHWFGVLVPQALKEAQGQFTAALDTVVQLANVVQSVPSRRPHA